MTTTPGPETRPLTASKLITDAAKPWMKPKPGETEAERVVRLGCTCYRCGVYIAHAPTLNLHQDQCDGKPPEDPGNWAR